MKLSNISLCAAALALGSTFVTVSAHATTLVGSDTITFTSVQANPGPGTSLFPISNITDFTFGAGATTSGGTGDLSGIPVLTGVTSSGIFYPGGALGELNPATAFTFTITGYGTFTETAAPVVESNGSTGTGASSVDLYLLGTFTPTVGGPLAGFSGGPASFDLAFNENGNAIGGFSYGAVGPLTSPPNASVTPEPSSLILLGTGLAGFAGAMRRKFRG